MNCKHCEAKGQTTKYFHCKIKNKAIDEKDCKDCMLKLPNFPEGFEQLFGSFRRRNQ